MKRHASDVETEITIVIKVSRNYAADTGKQGHSSRRHLPLHEKLGQPKSYRPVKVKVENSLYVACLVSRLEARQWRLSVLRHQVKSNLSEINPTWWSWRYVISELQPQ